MTKPATPLPLVHELFALEQQRTTLNMQIILLHALARQVCDAAVKFAIDHAARGHEPTPNH
jgi:Protein of unknown function (DUF3158)